MAIISLISLISLLFLLCSGDWAPLQLEQIITLLYHYYMNYISLSQLNVGTHLISDYNTLLSAEIIDIIG